MIPPDPNLILDLQQANTILSGLIVASHDGEPVSEDLLRTYVISCLRNMNVVDLREMAETLSDIQLKCIKTLTGTN